MKNKKEFRKKKQYGHPYFTHAKYGVFTDMMKKY